MEKIRVSKYKFKKMEKELRTLRNSNLYKRLLEFEDNVAQGKKYTRENLKF